MYLPAQKIVATGDILTANRADDNPNIHSEKNGSAEGWLANVKGMVGLNGTVYVPGHGDLQMKADIERRLAAVTARRAKVAVMIKEGKSLDDIKAGARPGGAGGCPTRRREGGRWSRSPGRGGAREGSGTRLRRHRLRGIDQEESSLRPYQRGKRFRRL